MPKLDFRSPRLFVDAPLAAGTGIALDRDQSNYLGNVLRLGAGDTVLLFNGRDGEWLASIAEAKKRDAILAVEGLDAVFIGRGDLTVAFGAPNRDAPVIRDAVDAVDGADDHDLFVDHGELAEIRWESHSALTVRGGVNSFSGEEPLENDDVRVEHRLSAEAIFELSELLFREDPQTFVYSFGDHELLT